MLRLQLWPLLRSGLRRCPSLTRKTYTMLMSSLLITHRITEFVRLVSLSACSCLFHQLRPR